MAPVIELMPNYTSPTILQNLLPGMEGGGGKRRKMKYSNGFPAAAGGFLCSIARPFDVCLRVGLKLFLFKIRIFFLFVCCYSLCWKSLCHPTAGGIYISTSGTGISCVGLIPSSRVAAAATHTHHPSHQFRVVILIRSAQFSLSLSLSPPDLFSLFSS